MRPIVINQHYIPKSYLKHFGFLVNAKKNKWSLYAMENGGEIERRTTENICSVDYLYDLPLVEGEERQFLEHAYEAQADRHFTEIKEFITDDSKTELPSEMREKILKSCLSLYYRTPKFIELDQQALEMIQRLPIAEREHAWKVKKTEILQESIYNFEALYNDKKNCGISVNKSIGKREFISGDNPVIITNGQRDLSDVLSPENIVHVPITPKYSITILPTNETTLNNTFLRYLYDDESVMYRNYDIERLHQKYLLGSQNALQAYLNEVPEYKKIVPADHSKVVSIEKRVIAGNHLLKIMEKSQGIITKEFKEQFNWYWNNLDGFKDDPNCVQFKKRIDSELG